MFVSIFDGRTEYPLEQTTRLRTGIYASDSVEAVVVHGRLRLPRRSALLDAPRAILRLYGWLEDGSDPVPSVTGKYRLDSVLPVAVLPWSSSVAHAQVPPQAIVSIPERRPSTAPPARPAQRPAPASMTGAATYRERGTHLFSERMQAFTAQLHEDVLAMQETLEVLTVRCSAQCRACRLNAHSHSQHTWTAQAPGPASPSRPRMRCYLAGVPGCSFRILDALAMGRSSLQRQSYQTCADHVVPLPSEQVTREQGRALATSAVAQGRARRGWLTRAMSR